MSNDLEAGQSRVGYAWDEKYREPYPAMLRDRDGRIELVVPYDQTDDALRRRYSGPGIQWGDDPGRSLHDYEPPDHLWFYDSHGFVCLIGVRWSGGQFGGQTILSEARLTVGYAVFTGDPGIDYTKVNGFTAHIEGLAEWFGVRSVSSSWDDPRKASRTELTISVKKPTTVALDRKLNLSIRAGSRWRRTMGIGRTTIDDFGQSRTLVKSARDWDDHLDRHRAIHELLEIAAWRQLGFHDVKAMHAADPQKVLSGEVVGERWADVRTYALPEPTGDSGRLHYLFTFGDVGAQGVRRWLRLRDEFSRGISALTFSLRHKGTSLEGLISDAGIGLEDLGHRIRQAGGLPATRKHHLNLEAIAAEVENLLPFSGRDWATESTRVYNGVKHANLPDPDVDEMYVSLKQNRMVFRMWLARRIGVRDATIQNGIWLLER